MSAASLLYLKVGTGAACAGQARVAADIRPLSRVVTLSSDGNRGAEPPTGSGQELLVETGRFLLLKLDCGCLVGSKFKLLITYSSRVAHPSIQVKEKQDQRITGWL